MSGRWRTLRGGAVLMLAATGLAVAGPAQPAAAAGQRGAAFVFNYAYDQPVGTSYTPTGGDQYNSTSPGSPNNEIRHLDTGRYDVKIPGLVGFGATHVTAYGSDAADCIAGDTEAATYSLVDVECFDAAGNPVDHAFTLSFTNVNQPGRQMAYMEVESNGVIWASRHFNGGGGLSTVIRRGATYVVRIPGLGSRAGHVQVTSAHPAARCKVSSWSPYGSYEDVVVTCWHRGGFAYTVDAPFVLTYVNQQNILGLPAGVAPAGHESAYAWASEPTADSTAYWDYQYSTSGRGATGSRYDVGGYVMTFSGVRVYNGTAQVTAYGYGPEFCAVSGWAYNLVQVQCYGPDGTPADTLYTVAFTRG
jgi:hypothetical protein